MAKLDMDGPVGGRQTEKKASRITVKPAGGPALSAPGSPDSGVPLLFEKPRRRFGCGLWVLIVLVLACLGAFASWQLMSDREREDLRHRVTEFVRETPLEFLREVILPKFDTKPPVPPINSSGDGGVLPERPDRAEAPGDAGLPAIQPESQDAQTPVEPGAEAGGTVTDQDEETAAAGTPLPSREDDRVRPDFVNDLAGFVVDRYRPSAKGGSVSVSVQGLNRRYGTSLKGLAVSRPGDEGRAQILRYAFTPSMVRALYDIYADSFLRSVAEQAQSGKKPVTKEQLGALYRSLGSRCTVLAAGLQSVAEMQDLPGRLSDLDRLEEGVTVANRQLLDARFDLEMVRDQGGSTVQAQARVDNADLGLRQAMRRHAEGRARLAEDIRRQGSVALDDDSLIYLARWVGRRLSDNPISGEAVRESAAVLRDLAGRCAKASREGPPPLPVAAPAQAAPAMAAPAPNASPSRAPVPAGAQTGAPVR